MDNENMNNNELNSNDQDMNKGYIKVYLFFGAIFAGFALIIALKLISDEKAKCAVSYCHDKHMADSEYCYYHYKSKLQSKWSSNKLTTGSKNSSSVAKASTGKSFTKSSSSSSSKGYSSSKNSKMNDPMEYDSPEDYADDAWGTDFDDYDDAYDYWEDIMD